MAGEGLASFIVGLMKGKGEAEKEKKKKEKARIAAAKAKKTEERAQRTENVSFWTKTAARFDADSPAKEYALSMIAYHSDSSGTMAEPVISGNVHQLIYGTASTTPTAAADPNKPESLIPADKSKTEKKNIKASHIQATLKRWYNTQSDEFRSKNPNWVPSFSNVLADIERFDKIVADIQGDRADAVREATTEKSDMDIAKANKKAYIDDLDNNIALLFDEISLYDFQQRNKNTKGYNDTWVQYLTAMQNMRKVSGGKVPTKPIDEAGMNRLIEYLQLYERLTGDKYKFSDEVWHMKVGDPESGKEGGYVVPGGNIEEVLGSTTTLADMYARATFVDFSTQEDFRAQPLKYFAENKNYKKAFDLVTIYDKEASDYDAVRLKIEEIQNKLNTYQQTIFMRDWSANHDFTPIIDDRKQIKDMREKVVNKNLGNMKPNKNKGNMMPNPNYDEEAHQAAIAAQQTYGEPTEIIDEREEVEDTDTHIDNVNYFPTSQAMIDNPNFGHPLPFGDISPSGKYSGDPANLYTGGAQENIEKSRRPSLGFPYAQKEDED